MPSRFEKFSERARKVLALAQEEAQRFNHSYIGTEHILLGLSREPEGIASKVLEVLGIDGKRIRTAVEFIVGQGDNSSREDIGLTDRAKKVIELASVMKALHQENINDPQISEQMAKLLQGRLNDTSEIGEKGWEVIYENFTLKISV
mgnify:CR=1 FL=1